MKKLHRSDDRDERGFTLLELMVVVLIIGILLAFAIPQFLKARSGSQEKQAQSNVRVALSATAQYLEENGDYTGLDPTSLEEFENSVEYIATTSTDSNEIGVVAADPYDVTLVSRADSGYCYFIRSVISDANGAGDPTGTTYGVGTASGTTCTADIGNADLASDHSAKVGWKRP